MDASTARIVAELPDDHYRVKDLKGETYDPQTQTVAAVLVEADGKEVEQEIPIYVLPRLEPIADLYDFNIAQPGFAEGVSTPLSVGDPATAEERHDKAVAHFGWPGKGKRPRSAGEEVHIIPHKHAAESAFIPNGFGGAGPLAASQNSAEGGYYVGFLTRSRIRAKQGARYLQLHIPIDDPFWESYRVGLPGARGK